MNIQGNESNIPFRIEVEIDTNLLHCGPRQRFAEDGRLKKYVSSGQINKIGI